jgi:hypothetical protein
MSVPASGGNAVWGAHAARRRVALVLIEALVGLLLVSCGGRAAAWKGSDLSLPFQAGAATAYVLDAADPVELEGVTRLLGSLGHTVRIVTDVDPSATGNSLIWVPESASHSDSETAHVFDALNRGARIVLAGPSAIASMIGLRFGPAKVKLTGERYVASPDLPVTWAKARETYQVSDTRGDYVVATTPDGKHPVAMSGAVGKGKFLWLAVGSGAMAVERFPMAPLMLRDLLGVPTSAVTRQGIDLYVDPGTLKGVKPDTLADRWLQGGVRRLYLAGWEFGFDSGNADYDGYIAAAHRRGIAVYAWLAPPVVNDRFYETHPDCHEKTATGVDAVGDWRKLVALEVPACRDAAIAAYRSLLTTHDWDGVNVAELYFEGPLAGADRPDLFTPMSDWVRADFNRVAGFDPKDVFTKGSPRSIAKTSAPLATFMKYRQNLVLELHRQLVTAIRGPLDVVVTTIDDRLAPTTAANVGVNIPKLQELARSLHFELQYEDPFTVWTQGPSRYDELRAQYPAGTVFDVNVVDRPGGTPTALPTGTELLTTVAAAAGTTGRIALYAEGTVAPVDLPWLAGAVGAAATVKRVAADGTVIDVESPFSVWVSGPADTRSATVDGAPWPLVDGSRVLVVPGRHRVEFSPAQQPVVAVRSCSCDIGAAHYAGSDVLVYYSAPSRAWLTLSHPVGKVIVDSAVVATTPAGGDAVAVALPAGGHTVTFR